ncbi:hypothetical protein KR200_003902, partial [Drosophila serrata]
RSSDPVPAIGGDSWSTVVRRKKQTRKARHDTVIVEAPGKSYNKILALVTRREDSKLTNLGGSVSKVRRTARGILLLEVARGSHESAESMRDSISQVFGDAAEVRALTEESKVCVFEIRNLDAITTESEIRTAFSDQYQLSEAAVRIRSLRPGYRKTKTAVLSLPSSLASEVRRRGEVRIGWTRCRVREREGPPRCFRSLELGHIAISAAQDLLTQTVREVGADVAIISEPYRVREGGEWAKDRTGKAALWLCGDGLRQMSNILAAIWRLASRWRPTSVIDITFTSRAISHSAKWEVSDVYTGSDHEAILCSVGVPEAGIRSVLRPA